MFIPRLGAVGAGTADLSLGAGPPKLVKIRLRRLSATVLSFCGHERRVPLADLSPRLVITARPVVVVKSTHGVLDGVVVVNCDHVGRKGRSGLFGRSIDDIMSPRAVPIDNNCRAQVWGLWACVFHGLSRPLESKDFRPTKTTCLSALKGKASEIRGRPRTASAAVGTIPLHAT